MADELTGKDRPDLKLLQHYVMRGEKTSTVITKWEDLGIALLSRQYIGRLDIIKANYFKVEERCTEMFKLWLETDERACWDDLVRAMVDIEANTAADHLKKLLQAGDNGPIETSLHSPELITKAVSEFTTLINLIGIKLKENELDNLEAIKGVCSYLPVNVHSETLLFSDEELAEIDACKTIRGILRKLRRRMRWNDHLVLTTIINSLNISDCNNLLDNFEAKIYCHLTLADIYEETKKCETYELPKDYAKMIVVVNKRFLQFTLEDYEQLRQFICTHCNVESYVLPPFETVSMSSLLLEWFIPISAVDIMVKAATENRAMFIQESFLYLKISSHEILDLKSDFAKQLEIIAAALSPVDYKDTIHTLQKIFDNIAQNPDVDKYRQLRLENKNIKNKLWRHPTVRELMRMSGWVVEGDFVRLRDGSRVKMVSEHLRMQSLGSSPTCLPVDHYKILVSTVIDGDTSNIREIISTYKVNVSAGVVFSANGSSMNLMKNAIAFHHMDVACLYVEEYSFDINTYSAGGIPYSFLTFEYAPQSFIIDFFVKFKVDYKTKYRGISLLHTAVLYNCDEVVEFLVKSSHVNIDALDDNGHTPLHVAHMANHERIVAYLVQQGASSSLLRYLRVSDKLAEYGRYVQNKRKICEHPLSDEHIELLKLLNAGMDDEQAVALTMAKFPSLRNKEPSRARVQKIDRNLAEYMRLITEPDMKKSFCPLPESYQFTPSF